MSDRLEAVRAVAGGEADARVFGQGFTAETRRTRRTRRRREMGVAL